ncbi:hypothetical protein CRP603_gp52 [Roseobacter phage CRP-603]|nr:hypothetical protein CRP603_gp52 [Roseobacter phage CRP-603]
MSNVKKLMMTAASAGDAVNVEDVFNISTHYGENKAIAINNGIALADGPTGELGSSTEFDGSSDYLQKTSDLSGNSDGKTFTFSFWIYPEPANNNTMYIYHTSGSWRNTISWTPSNGRLFVSFFANESSGGTVFEIQAPLIKCPRGKWSHVIFSADMTDSNKRHLYINDIDASPSWTYSNQNIDFTRSTHAIADDQTGSTGNFKGKIAHFYYDRTYRDLSVESNRRNFIDANLGSTSVATQSALNPILYLPMTDGYTVGENEGSGGNFSGVGSPTIVADSGTEAEADHGKGGLVWIKGRDVAYNHSWWDTERGRGFVIRSSGDAVEYDYTSYGYGVNTFDATGFSLDPVSVFGENTNGNDFVSWTFRKQPKFFDIVTWSGDGTSSGRTISHNLGATPGMVVVKNRDFAMDWQVWHRELPSGHRVLLNQTNGSSAQTTVFGNGSTAVDPTSTEFTVGISLNNASHTYVAYIFAHNDGDGEFGPTGDQDIIKCGTYTGTGTESLSNVVDVGFEPQWLLVKRRDTAGQWVMIDDIRGFHASRNYNDNGLNRVMYTHSTATESNDALLYPQINGFSLVNNNGDVNASNGQYIYVAIRRGLMGFPTKATDVFATDTLGSTGDSLEPGFRSGFPVDLATFFLVNSTYNKYWFSRLANNWNIPRGLTSDQTNAEQSFGSSKFDYSNGWNTQTHTAQGQHSFMWRRAPSFLDVVTFKAGTSSNRRISHSLGVTPEMIWVKRRDGDRNWYVYHKDMNANPRNYKLHLNTSSVPTQTNDIWGTSDPTATDFGINENDVVGTVNSSCVAYLFATLDGISKVGTYTGNGTNQNIDCGFSNTARFVLVKAVSTTSNWQLAGDFDNGIVAGNDSLWRIDLNNAATSFDFIDPYSGGFNVTGAQLNTSGVTYIFYAVA